MSYLNILQIAKSGKRSTFGQELENLFQIVIDKRDSIDESRPEARNRIVEEVFDLLTPDFSTVIKKHTNLNITVVSLPGTEACCSATNVSPKIIFGHSVDRTRIYHNSNTGPATVEDLIKISNSTIDYYVVNPEQYVYNYFEFKLYIDPIYFFNRKNNINVHIEDLIAEEATAILFHEIYHLINILKRCGECKKRLLLLQDHYSYFMEKAGASEQFKLLKTISQSQHHVDQKTTDSIDEVIKIIDRYTIETVDNNTEYQTIKANLKDITRIVLFSMFVLPAISIGNQITGMSGHDPKKDTIVKNGKTYINNDVVSLKQMDSIDDLPGFRTGFMQVEMESDAFAAKHGYGAFLISANNKLLGMTAKFSKEQRKSKFAYQLNCAYNYLLNNALPETDFYTYEDFGNRFNSVRLNTIKELKHNFNNPALLNMYLNSIKEMEKHTDEIRKKISTRDFFQSIHKFFTYGWKDELDKLMKHIQTLQNNDLYISAAKLQQMRNED